jgi:hypothetical protein
MWHTGGKPLSGNWDPGGGTAPKSRRSGIFTRLKIGTKILLVTMSIAGNQKGDGGYLENDSAHSPSTSICRGRSPAHQQG